MDRVDFKNWCDDLQARMPQLGAYVAKLPRVTRDIWFDDYFADFKLDEAIEITKLICEEGGVAGYDRDSLPTKYKARIQEWRWLKRQREIKAEEKRLSDERQAEYGKLRGKPGNPIRMFDRSMVEHYQVLSEARENYREQHGKPMPEHEWRAFCDAHWEKANAIREQHGANI